MAWIALLLGEIFSIRMVGKILNNIDANVYIKQANKGFKINVDKANKFIDESEAEWRKKTNKRFRKLKLAGLILLFLVPGVNIIAALVKSHKDQKRTIKIIEENDCLVPLCPLEKLDYSYAYNRELQYKYAMKYSESLRPKEEVEKEKAKKEEIMAAIEAQIRADLEEQSKVQTGEQAPKPNIVPGHVTPVAGERLVAISYTLDEIKELSNVINEPYRLGKVDGINTALVGVPKAVKEIKRVIFTSDGEKQICYDFEPINEEEAKTKRFIVYPFKKEYEKTLDKAVFGLIEKRNRAAAEYQGTINGQRTNYSSMEISGPSLVRKMK